MSEKVPDLAPPSPEFEKTPMETSESEVPVYKVPPQVVNVAPSHLPANKRELPTFDNNTLPSMTKKGNGMPVFKKIRLILLFFLAYIFVPIVIPIKTFILVVSSPRYRRTNLCHGLIHSIINIQTYVIYMVVRPGYYYYDNFGYSLLYALCALHAIWFCCFEASISLESKQNYHEFVDFFKDLKIKYGQNFQRLEKTTFDKYTRAEEAILSPSNPDTPQNMI
ncbi:hypothetical protein WR25_26935 [Diploscapter pachys]|uniref:Uncharacterized protein n=1 Tax=Diploscapter pachys TaxID=2018661 RepID=A0A2A2JUV1_9BILA|nr:hypothetical protein WR25_26935 [Diploscapter pachys]